MRRIRVRSNVMQMPMPTEDWRIGGAPGMGWNTLEGRSGDESNRLETKTRSWMVGKSRMPRWRRMIRRPQHRKTPREVSTPRAAAESKRHFYVLVKEDGIHLSEELLRALGIKPGTPYDLELVNLDKDKDEMILRVRPRSRWGLSLYSAVEEAAA
jgi:hypothetical protein